MNSLKASKFISERPGSSAKEYEYENSNYAEGSKIPRYPKRTYSLEGKKSLYNNRTTLTKQKISTTSMIPRLERKKPSTKIPVVSGSNENTKNGDVNQTKPIPREKSFQVEEKDEEKTSLKSISSLECKVNKDFIKFKNNVLQIPEYWTDAGETATNILTNAINIVTKQYPTIEKESIGTEIESILKATETVKQQILTKTENIINKASQIYTEKSETATEAGEEDLRKITKKMKELRNEVNVRKNVFGDLLKCGSEMKHIVELEKVLKCKGVKNSPRKDSARDTPNYDFDDHKKGLDEKKSKTFTQITYPGHKKKEKKNMQSCGDIIKDELKTAVDVIHNHPEGPPQSHTKDKNTQTMNVWTAELHKKEKNLHELNQQILDLQNLCKEHIAKFKSFSLQIKLRGICSKAQHMTISKELESLTEEKLQLEEKNSQLKCYAENLESTIKQKELDLHQKDKLINQQKKLLHVRDELIEMLKSRCNVEEIKRY